ncbi:uncharacterized protein LOC111057546 isoform X4 [Nilaparvata lugens]|uniref:uncharacterized protein LOC111057546 isoform X4 n=1 Tax=Nilaparvata lugens TaxID=108931 RepID=UPI00193E0D89|nr:uncharacterized protein LOC111057546 isoform X4 [Nilaparvata lugens]
MGQCVSSRSEKGVLARSKGAPPTKNPFKHRHIKMDKGKQQQSASAHAHTRGEAMSFGFKRPTTAHAQLPAATPAPAASDEKKELSSVDSLVMQQNCTARSGTPRLARPKKDATGNSNTRTNRFGFRNTTALSNKVADSQKSDTSSLYINNYADNTPSRTDSKSSVVKLSSNRSTASSDSARSASSLSDDNHSSSRASSKGGAKSQSQPQPSATRFTLLTSHLPRPQFPVRLAASAAHYKSPDKSAKTAANNYTARKAAHSDNGNGSSASSTTDADSGTGSQKNGDLDAHGITTLEESPSAKNKLRKKSRPLEMVFLNNEKKTFELRELQDSIEVTEIVPLELPVAASGSGRIVQERGGFVQERGGIVQERARAYQQATMQPQLQQQQLFSSDEEESDEGFDDEGCGEEKQHRDRLLSEKVERSNCLGGGEGDADELWGHGEAMIGEDDLSNPSSGENNGDIDKMNPPLRSVLLKIEDPAFATLAAMSTSTMLEDETSPDFSSSPPSSTADLGLELTQPTVQLDKKNNLGGSPESPGTPTHASNSLSLSEGRGDFLIDDEIADQPGLVFDETVTANSSANTIMPNSNDTTPIAVELPPKTTGRIGQLSHDSPAHHNSVGTLSPCESITSDDMMIDYNPSEASSFDDINVDRRLEMIGLSENEEAALRSDIEAIKNDEVLKEWSSRLSLGMGNGVRATHFLRSRVGSTGSGGGGGDSPRSLPLDTPRLRGSPLRPSRQGNSSPGEDFSEDSGIRLDRTTHQDMFQDVISIKTMLLRLTRVLQETDQVNAFENSLNNGYYNLGNEGSQEDVTSQKKEIAEEISDLKRQVLFLQQQLEERDRTISGLQTRLQETRTPPSTDPPPQHPRQACNAATQTERVRPLSSGPSLLQGLPTDSMGGNLVSNSIEACARASTQQSKCPPPSGGTLSSRVPVAPWRKQSAEQAPRKLPTTPLPQRRKAS